MKRLVAAAALVSGLAVVVFVARQRDGGSHAARVPDQLAGSLWGAAHIDIMDLHVERLPAGGGRPRSILPEGDLADRYAKARAANLDWNRWSLYWDFVESDAGWDWSAADGIVGRDRAAGLASLVILQGTPPRHATGGHVAGVYPTVGGGRAREMAALGVEVAPQSSPPSGLERHAFLDQSGAGTDDPARAERINPANPWAVFVDAAVERYRPGGTLARQQGWDAGQGVTAWEIGNEPNLAHFWSGTPEEFVRYLEVAYLVVKRLSPEATVVHGGIADDAAAPAWYQSFLRALRARAAATPLVAVHNYYFDAAGWHWYAYPSLLRTGPGRAREYLAAAGIPSKPIWVTELGVPLWNEYPGPCWDAHSPWRATTVEQAGYVWQSAAEALAQDVAVLVYFQMYDDCGNGPASYDAFGLVRNHAANQCWIPPGHDCWNPTPALAGRPRAAYDALAALVRWAPVTVPLWRPAQEADGWQRVLVFAPPDKRVTFLWNPSRHERTAEVLATGPEGRLLEIRDDGTVLDRAVAPQSGRYTLRLAPATNRNNPGNQAPIMAGRPIVLVERDTLPPFRAVVQAPAAADGPTVPVSVLAADGGTGIGAFRLLVAESPPAGPGAWSVLGGDRPWTADPLAGQVDLNVTLTPGRTYYLAAQAADRAGNWSSLPDAAQAVVQVGRGAPTPVPTDVPRAGPGRLVLPSLHARSVMRPPVSTATPAPTRATESPPLRQTDTPEAAASSTPTVTAEETAPAPTSSATTIACPGGTVAVRVTGPTGTLLSDPAGRWFLRAFAAVDAPPLVTTYALGESGCLPSLAARLEAFASVPAFASLPPQDLGLSDTLTLHVAPNRLSNGTFEAGLAGWEVEGEVPPEPDAGALSGRGAVRFGSEVARAGASTLSQIVAIPAGSPIVSFMAHVDARLTCDGQGCRYGDRFDIIAVPVDGPDIPALVTPAEGLTTSTPGWVPFWYDLSAWAGRRVRLVFALGLDAEGPTRIWLDNVAVSEDGAGR